MKKISIFLFVTLLCYCHLIYSNVTNPPYSWTGFYAGAHAGYWNSVTDKISITGQTSYFDPTFEWGSHDIANALTKFANNNFSFNSAGFLGGAEVGYNYAFKKGLLVGLNWDIDGVTDSNNTWSLQKNIALDNFDENYLGTMTVFQKLNYLSSLRARLGYLLEPTFLVYATFGFAYANVNLDSSWYAQESLGATVFSPIAIQNNVSKTISGWTAGGGVEWLFRTNWSAVIEYDYYSMNKLNTAVTLSQINSSLTPAVLWASTLAKTTFDLSFNTIKIGLNYHFS